MWHCIRDHVRWSGEQLFCCDLRKLSKTARDLYLSEIEAYWSKEEA
jgi:hypothetical protein